MTSRTDGSAASKIVTLLPGASHNSPAIAGTAKATLAAMANRAAIVRMIPLLFV